MTINTKQATRLALDLYGLDGQLSPLDGELDANFLLVGSDGRRFVLKVMHKACATASVDLQCAVLEHFRDSATGVRLPRVVLTLAGSAYATALVAGEERIVWLLAYRDGLLLRDYRPHSDSIYRSFGEVLGQLSDALANFSHPAMTRRHPWLLTNAAASLADLQHVDDAARGNVSAALRQFKKSAEPHLGKLRHSVIHNDANDHNVLVDADSGRVVGLFDFGDMGFQPTVCEVAIALAYLLMGKDDPLPVCATFVAAFHEQFPLEEGELDVLFVLVKTRLAVSIATSSRRANEQPGAAYLAISQAPAIKALAVLCALDERVAGCYLRYACGFGVTPRADEVRHYLQSPQAQPAAVVRGVGDFVLDLSVGSTLLGANPDDYALPALTQTIDQAMREAGAAVALGRYAESRALYATGDFGVCDHATRASRTHHLGIDVFCAAGTPVYTPFDARVELLANNDRPLDFGPLLILRHETDNGAPFFTLYGHLALASLKGLKVGDRLRAGAQVAQIGVAGENGGWPPHLHLQLVLDTLDLGDNFPGVAFESQADFWRALSPNPAALLHYADPGATDGRPDNTELARQRTAVLGRSLRLSYSSPLHAVRGYRQFLYDAQAHAYLDMYNNVPHVGHSHPRVVAAVRRQIGLLNTNTRYLHANILRYAQSLTARLPESLAVCFFVNSASEANELAVRLARAHTNRHDMLVVAGAYHGHTSSLVDMSPYKYNGPGGRGAPDWVHEVSVPDDYRGQYKRGDANAGPRYAAQIEATLRDCTNRGRPVAGFIAETYPSVAGQIIPPAGYLTAAYSHVRAHGGVCIADEVQTGFGRLGDSYWAFESQGATPDIVVLGKPIANGFPMGAVVTTTDIAASFDNGMEFFSTFGGNPVACAAAQAVMEVVDDERLQDNAQRLGDRLLGGLRDLQAQHSLIGDVRGEGLYIGIELVCDRESLAPAAAQARYVVDRLRELRVLVGIDGLYHNVVKIRPSMVSTDDDIELVLEALARIFSETRLRA